MKRLKGQDPLIHFQDLEIYNTRSGKFLTQGEKYAFLKSLALSDSPTPMFFSHDGLGDNLLLSAVALNSFKATTKPVLLHSAFPELFYNNPHVSFVLNGTHAKQYFPSLLAWLYQHKIFPVFLTYWQQVCTQGRNTISAPNHHMIVELCRQAGIQGTALVQPFMPQTPASSAIQLLLPDKEYIAIQSVGKTPWKDWGVENFQAIVDTFKRSVAFIQIGAAEDAPLSGALDLRGKLTFPELAFIIRQAQLFVGNVGGLMHFARSVDTNAVIAYTAAESYSLASYSCNINVLPAHNCTLCNTGEVQIYINQECPSEIACLKSISVNHMVEAVEKGMQLPPPQPEEYTIPDPVTEFDLNRYFQYNSWLAACR